MVNEILSSIGISLDNRSKKPLRNNANKVSMVGLGGLELPTKRLSVASSERSVKGPLVAIYWLAKCPRWRSYVYDRLVSANSRLNFNVTVSAA